MSFSWEDAQDLVDRIFRAMDGTGRGTVSRSKLLQNLDRLFPDEEQVAQLYIDTRTYCKAIGWQTGLCPHEN